MGHRSILWDIVRTSVLIVLDTAFLYKRLQVYGSRVSGTSLECVGYRSTERISKISDGTSLDSVGYRSSERISEISNETSPFSMGNRMDIGVTSMGHRCILSDVDW
jgi:hypothetical protein